MKSRWSRRVARLVAGASLLALLRPGAALGLDVRKAITQYAVDVWQTDQGLPQSSVFAIAQTPDGYLWLGTDEGLVRFDGVRMVVFDRRNTPGLRHNGIRALAVDREGSLWIGADGGGVSRLKDGVFTAFTSKEGLCHDGVRALAVDRAGVLWIGTRGGLGRYAGGIL